MLPETPKFWRQRGLAAFLLLPASWLYLIGHKLKTIWSAPYKSTLPVICIGGVVAGGSGKTPCVHALLALIRDQASFVNPVVLTRGYGGVIEGPSLIDLDVHTVSDVGDEAFLHASLNTTIVSRDRAAGARLAEAMGADLIIMDDGLQNATIAKTHSFLVLDARQGIGNGFLLPAGPLREPLNDALKKCTAILQTNGQAPVAGDKPVFQTSLRITSSHDMTRSYFAFAGMGHPEKFRETLEQNGFNLASFKNFPDHYPYTQKDMEMVIEQAGTNALITTEKDYVRIPESYQSSIHVLKIELTFDRPGELMALLMAGIKA
jgi:tetraacyldisaccharide 4'-kinase